MVCVRPGVLLVNASLRCPVRALIKLDFPTLLLPRNAISGRASEGNCSGLLALAKNSANNLTTTFRLNVVGAAHMAPQPHHVQWARALVHTGISAHGH